MQTERVARKHNWDLYNREDYIDKLMREDKSMTRRKAIRAWNEKLADQSTHREMEEGQEVIAVRTRTSISHTQSIEARRQIAGEKALDGPDGLLARFLRGETPGTSRLGCGLGGGRGQPALEREPVTPGIAARAGGSQCEQSSRRSAAAPAAPKAGALAACDRGEHEAITEQQALVQKRAFLRKLADLICTFKAS